MDPAGQTSEVVGAAIIRQSRVLAAKRRAHGDQTGGWEFPGGKVEAGETREAALVREVGEELAVIARVVGWLSPEVPLPGGFLLRVAVCEATGEPVCREHEEIAWLNADELASVGWLSSDRAFLAGVRDALTGS